MFCTVIITFTNKSNGEKVQYRYTAPRRYDCENRTIRMIVDSNITVNKVEFIDAE